MIPQGTTPTHTFTLPIDTSELKTIRVIYKQDGLDLLVKTGADLKTDGNVVSVTLTQEETLGFDSNRPVYIQLRALTLSGDALKSRTYTRSVDQCLEKEVIS